jgi:hypothetical protein
VKTILAIVKRRNHIASDWKSVAGAGDHWAYPTRKASDRLPAFVAVAQQVGFQPGGVIGGKETSTKGANDCAAQPKTWQ